MVQSMYESRNGTEPCGLLFCSSLFVVIVVIAGQLWSCDSPPHYISLKTVVFREVFLCRRQRALFGKDYFCFEYAKLTRKNYMVFFFIFFI